MPKRKGILFSGRGVLSARITKSLIVGFDNSGARIKKHFFGELRLKNGRFASGKSKAQNVFLKPVSSIAACKAELLIRKKLKRAGLPVLGAGIAMAGKKVFWQRRCLPTEKFQALFQSIASMAAKSRFFSKG